MPTIPIKTRNVHVVSAVRNVTLSASVTPLVAEASHLVKPLYRPIHTKRDSVTPDSHPPHYQHPQTGTPTDGNTHGRDYKSRPYTMGKRASSTPARGPCATAASAAGGSNRARYASPVSIARCISSYISRITLFV